MTKKDYELIAAVIKHRANDDTTIAERTMLNTLTLDLADKFGEQNPAFNRGKFLRAADFTV